MNKILNAECTSNFEVLDMGETIKATYFCGMPATYVEERSWGGLFKKRYLDVCDVDYLYTKESLGKIKTIRTLIVLVVFFGLVGVTYFVNTTLKNIGNEDADALLLTLLSLIVTVPMGLAVLLKYNKFSLDFYARFATLNFEVTLEFNKVNQSVSIYTDQEYFQADHVRVKRPFFVKGHYFAVFKSCDGHENLVSKSSYPTILKPSSPCPIDKTSIFIKYPDSGSYAYRHGKQQSIVEVVLLFRTVLRLG